MHRQQSTHSLRSLKLGACQFVFNILLVITGGVFTAVGLIGHVDKWLWTGAIIMALWVVSVFLFFVLSYSWKCPLCLGKIWVNTGCRRHQKAKQALGVSYRLAVASSVLRRKPYRCPYCGESFSTTKTRK